jgi:hypothetical protein
MFASIFFDGRQFGRHSHAAGKHAPFANNRPSRSVRVIFYELMVLNPPPSLEILASSTPLKMAAASPISSALETSATSLFAPIYVAAPQVLDSSNLPVAAARMHPSAHSAIPATPSPSAPAPGIRAQDSRFDL